MMKLWNIKVNKQYEIYGTLSSIIFWIMFCALLLNSFAFLYFLFKKNKPQSGPTNYQEVVKKIVKRELKIDVKIVQQNRFTQSKFKKIRLLDEERENKRLGLKTYLNPHVFYVNKKAFNKDDYFSITNAIIATIQGIFKIKGSRYKKFIFTSYSGVIFMAIPIWMISFMGIEDGKEIMIWFYIISGFLFIALFFHFEKFRFTLKYLNNNKHFFCKSLNLNVKKVRKIMKLKRILFFLVFFKE